MISFAKCCVHFVRANLFADELAWGLSWFPSPAPAAQQPVTRNPKKSSGKRQHHLQIFQAANPQLLTVPPALLPFWGLWDSKTICLVVPAVGILPVLSIPALAVPPFSAVPAVAVVAVAAAGEVGEVPALTVAMDVAVATVPVPGGVTVAAATFGVALDIVVALDITVPLDIVVALDIAVPLDIAMALDIVVALGVVVALDIAVALDIVVALDVVVALGVVVAAAALPTAATLPTATALPTAAALPTPRALAMATVPVLVVPFSDNAAAFSTVGAGVRVVEALCSGAWKSGNAAQAAGAGEARDALGCRGGCNGALGAGGVLLR